MIYAIIFFKKTFWSKFCFRGRCQPRSESFQNMELGLCLQASNKFSSSDKPILKQCTDGLSPPFKLMVSDNGAYGNLLLTPYSNVENGENSAEKCLTIHPTTLELHYTKCRKTLGDMLGWNLNMLNVEANEFQMIHLFTNTCIRAYPNGMLKGEYDCVTNIKQTLWRKYNEHSCRSNISKTVARNVPGIEEIDSTTEGLMKSQESSTAHQQQQTGSPKFTKVVTATSTKFNGKISRFSNVTLKAPELIASKNSRMSWVSSMVSIILGIAAGAIATFLITKYRRTKKHTNVTFPNSVAYNQDDEGHSLI